MADIKETLIEAKEEIKNWEDKIKDSNTLNEKIVKSEKDLKEFESKKQKAIDDIMKQKKKEIDEHYNAIVVDLTKKKNEANDKKRAEIKKNKEERIERETKENKQNIEALKNQINDLLTENKVSKIAGTDFYFTYFKIVSVPGFIKAFLTYVVLIVGIPLIISYFWLGKDMFLNLGNIIKVGATFIINLFIWASIWLIINHFTDMPQDVYLKLKNLKYNIDDNKEQIKILTKTIMNDNDKTKYDYTDTDREIEQIDLDLETAKQQNEKDIKYLNTTIHDEVVKKIEDDASEELARLKDDYNNDKAKQTILTEEIDKLRSQIKEKYEALVGKDNLSSEKIDKIIQVFNSNNEQELMLKQAIEMSKKK